MAIEKQSRRGCIPKMAMYKSEETPFDFDAAALIRPCAADSATPLP
jgi:hypothetical protein